MGTRTEKELLDLRAFVVRGFHSKKGDTPMPLYMIQVAYSPEGWAALVKNPQDRTQVVRQPIEKIGGNVKDFWFSFGDHDVIGVVEFPDNVSAAAIAIAFAAGGACKSVQTTPLLTSAEGLEAIKKAGKTGYKSAVAGR
ncbi:MAG TPA: GYD domain-containing protein [Terriglobales bacterium]|nr:GYD domain-containing protein [Terriglobales bacterium]